MEKQFDSYWGHSRVPSLEIAVPVESEAVWERYLAQLLQEEFLCENRVGESLVFSGCESPSLLTLAEIERFIPNRNFVRLKLKKDQFAILNRALDGNPFAGIVGCQGCLSHAGASSRFDPDQYSSAIELIVDAQLLEQLPSHELQRLQYQLLPRDLHEILLHHLEERGQRFSRELLRCSQDLLNPEDESFL